MTKARWKIEAGLKAKFAVEALREQATGNDLAQCHQVHPNQIYAWKKHLLDPAARAFDPRVGLDAEAASAREIERLHAKACPRARPEDRPADDRERSPIESGTSFFAKRFGK